MSAPEPPPGGSGGGPGGSGEAAMQPDETRAFAARVDALEQGVAEAQAALDRLAAESLAVGSGEDNAAIAAWYRELVATDTLPAARTLAGELEALQGAVRQSVAMWEQADDAGARSLRPDTGPS
ncbi:hypothetical protein [Actinomycetospora cinnamomea]|uniref:Excreted virulence factor EspC (Type VII ESX diderm) n=1 Tax=Actinomycetospora cinnamomea TaxID=663609 RepID=A0A2U1FBP8_9PSEU|nr:hypothetical protein [Actinomycetospora cinnamomea]PVZ09615.1 hypothetical protein C8D89_106279 [Actinomycetospora cinnamomea]